MDTFNKVYVLSILESIESEIDKIVSMTTDSIEYKSDETHKIYPIDLTIKTEIDEILKHIGKLKGYISTKPKVEVVNDLKFPKRFF